MLVNGGFWRKNCKKGSIHMRFLVVLLGFIALFPLMVAAGEVPRSVSVQGHGSVETVPDMATITLGVSQQARSAGEALSAVASVSARIFASLEAAGIAPRDMQTSGLNLHPLFSNRASSSNAPPAIVGFGASNMVTIRVRDLSALGTILDLVAQDGANEFNGLSFGLQASDALQDEARIAAVHDAVARATVMAEAAGVTLGRVLSLSEAGTGNGPMMMARGAASFDAMPVAAGEVSISADVSMVFEIID